MNTTTLLICLLSNIAFASLGFYAGYKVRFITIRQNDTIYQERLNNDIYEEDAIVPEEDDNNVRK